MAAKQLGSCSIPDRKRSYRCGCSCVCIIALNRLPYSFFLIHALGVFGPLCGILAADAHSMCGGCSSETVSKKVSSVHQWRLAGTGTEAAFCLTFRRARLQRTARWKRSWLRDQDGRLDGDSSTVLCRSDVSLFGQVMLRRLDVSDLGDLSQEMPVDLRKKAADLLTQAPASMFMYIG